MMIARDTNRTEHDDFVLNVQHHLDNLKEAVPVYENGELTGWVIQWMYE